MMPQYTRKYNDHITSRSEFKGVADRTTTPPSLKKKKCLGNLKTKLFILSIDLFLENPSSFKF